MRILEIHEVHDWMLEMDLSGFDFITFDDGLYSQYKNYKHFLKYQVPLYFFISTGIVCEGEQDKTVISCDEAHEFAKKYDNRYYMTWDQIKEINSNYHCFIGGHSHSHPRLSGLKLKEQYEIAKQEVHTMQEEFKKHGINVYRFCYPYNEEIIGYKSELKKYGIFDLFGKDRIAIEELK